MFEPRPVEPDDGFAIDHRHRGGREALIDELIKRLLVFADILVRVGNALLAKELLHLATEQSAGLRVDHNGFSHT